MSDNFKPDSSIKKLLKEISKPELLKIINGLFGTSYPLDTPVLLENTEHFTIIGDADTSSRRGDLTAKLNPEAMQDELHDEVSRKIQAKIQNAETTNNVILEVQASEDSTMGFRVFVYALNVSDKQKNKNNEDVYVFPKGGTIYAVEKMKEKSGVDEVHMQIENFRVGENRYSADEGDLLTVEFPFVNILAMEMSDFENSDLELLKVIYPYRYKQKPDLLLDFEVYQEMIEKIAEFFKRFEGNDKIVVGELISNLFRDVYEIAKKDEEKYGKAVEIMATAERTYAEVLMADARFEGERNEKIETARRMLSKGMDFGIVADCTDLSIGEVQEIQNDMM
ncbi:MAG: hypothetical protein R3Y53_11095 [Bacillota bacterium]